MTLVKKFQADFTLEYQPLRVGETNTKLDFSNNELGNYFYELNLKATPAGPERALYFRTCLGQSHVQVGKFLNFAKQKTDYSCKVSVYLTCQLREKDSIYGLPVDKRDLRTFYSKLINMHLKSVKNHKFFTVIQRGSIHE